MALCDASTASGKRCKNFSEGSSNGRNYCGINSHKVQVLKMPSRGEDIDTEAVSAFAVVEEEVPVVSVAAPYDLEKAGWEALGSKACSCGGRLIFWSDVAPDPDTKMICMSCNVKVTLEGKRWK